MRLRSLLLLLLLLVLLTLPLAATASAAPFSRVFCFGDSYSDTGNWIRVSNGPVWIEHLGDRLGMPDVGLASRLGGDNYAVSAARATGSLDLDLEAQLGRYFADHPSGDPEALYLLFIGWNDLVAAPDRSAETLAAVTSAVDRLIEHGAERVVVLDVSNKVTTPRFLSASEEVRQELTGQLLRVNLGLQFEALQRAAWTEVVDVYALTTAVYLDPEAWGFEDASGHCSYDPVCEGYVWWDEVHPTTAFHRVLANRVLARLIGLPEDAVASLSPAEVEVLLAAPLDVGEETEEEWTWPEDPPEDPDDGDGPWCDPEAAFSDCTEDPGSGIGPLPLP